MQLNYSYWWFKDALPKLLCKDIIKFAKSKNQKNLGVVSGFDKKDTLTKKEKNEIKKVRNSNVVWLDEPWIFNKITPFVKTANKNAGWNYEFDFAEPAQFTIYNKEQFYGWHSDGANDIHSIKRRSLPGIYDEKHINSNVLTPIQGLVGKVRKLSITLMLSDPNDYDGGNLKFDFGTHEGNRFKEISGDEVQQGSMIVFPSYKYHCVTPVTRGTRYSLVIWFNGRPMK